MTEKSLLIFSFVFKLYLRKNCFLVKTFHSCDLTYSAVYLLSPVAFTGTATPVKNTFIYIREYMGTIAAISLVPVSKLCWESVREDMSSQIRTVCHLQVRRASRWKLEKEKECRLSKWEHIYVKNEDPCFTSLLIQWQRAVCHCVFPCVRDCSKVMV